MIDLTGIKILTFDIRAHRTGVNISIGIHQFTGGTTEIIPDILVADVFQTVLWDISAVPNNQKDKIDKIVIKIVDADEENTFYIDNFLSFSPLLCPLDDNITILDNIIIEFPWIPISKINVTDLAIGYLTLLCKSIYDTIIDTENVVTNQNTITLKLFDTIVDSDWVWYLGYVDWDKQPHGVGVWTPVLILENV
jgi:hypothetical protein